MTEAIIVHDLKTWSAEQNEGHLPFEDASTPNSLGALCLVILCMHTSKSLLFTPFFTRLGTQLGHATHGPKWVTQNTERIENFANFSFRFLIRCTVTGLGVTEYRRAPEWWHDTHELWVGFPNHFVSNTVQLLYLVQLAYHLDDLITVLVGGKSRRKDYYSMIIHHIVTVLLLFGSTRLHAQRIGCIISTLHAIPDIFADFAKMSKQMEWKLASYVGLGSLLIAWIVTRMVIFPFKYVLCTFTEDSTIPSPEMSPFARHMLRFLLCTLCVLNTMWFKMMLALLFRILKTGEASDPTTVDPQKQQAEEEENKEEEVEEDKTAPLQQLSHGEEDQSTSSETSDEISTTSSGSPIGRREPLGSAFWDATYACLVTKKKKTKTH